MHHGQGKSTTRQTHNLLMRWCCYWAKFLFLLLSFWVILVSLALHTSPLRRICSSSVIRKPTKTCWIREQTTNNSMHQQYYQHRAIFINQTYSIINWPTTHILYRNLPIVFSLSPFLFLLHTHTYTHEHYFSISLRKIILISMYFRLKMIVW